MLKEELVKPPERFVESIRRSIQNEVSKGKTSVEKERLFLKWVLTKVFHATEDDAENGRLDGPNDQGIDAILEMSFHTKNEYQYIHLVQPF